VLANLFSRRAPTEQTPGRSITRVIIGTFTLRCSTGLTGATLVYYLAELPRHGGRNIDPLTVGALAATFYFAELTLAPLLGALSDRWGQKRFMQLGPGLGSVAVVLTGLTTRLPLLFLARLFEGCATAASVPSILSYIARTTSDDDALRGRAVARFEAATLAGLGVGMVIAGPLYQAVGPVAFFINAGLYGVAWMIYRFGVPELPAPPLIGRSGSAPTAHDGWRRYWTVLSSPGVWLLAPTWLAVNTAIGLWTSQSIFQLVKVPAPRFANQRLMGGFHPLDVSIGLGAGLLVFFAGIFYWGGRFKKMRPTTILFYGLAGFLGTVACVYVINHGEGRPAVLPAVMVAGAAAGVFVLAGATPAALGLLAGISESHPHDRGTVMGLYSLFLALGQITGSLIGGEAAHLSGIDGILAATLVLVLIALLPLSRLRSHEHRFGRGLDQELTPLPPTDGPRARQSQ
jgi:MFS family permease